jgi:phosphoribosyl-ATP pyrophosphohydrolase
VPPREDGEEACEEASRHRCHARQPEAVVMESADLIYNLVVLWVHAGVRPEDVWAEMRRRELMFGIAEKVPKDLVRAASRRKVVTLESRRVRKRR